MRPDRRNGSPEGWASICDLEDVIPGTGVCALVEGRQIAVFRVTATAVFALDNFDPASGANVLSRGLVGDLKGERVVASPLYKHHYSLTTGRCLEDPDMSVTVHRARVLDGRIWLKVGGVTVKTTCPYCGVGCGVLAHNTGAVVEIAGDPSHPANLGALCSKGYALGETLGDDGRLLRPQIGGAEVSWDEALSHVGHQFSRIIEQHGPAAVAFYVSGQLLTEDYYVANKLMKGYIGSANIDTNSRLCMASAVAGHKRAFGEDVVPVSYEDLRLADLIVLVGSNTAWCHPVLFRQIMQAKERRPQLKLVVIDPRRTPTCELADLHLPLRAGSDVWLFNGLLAYLSRQGLRNAPFVQNHTSGAADALEAADLPGGGDERAVASACGIDVERLRQFYEMFAAHERVVTAFSQGVNQSSAGTDKVNSIINCHLLTGRIGRPGMGPFSLTGQPNAMGGREVGGMANMLAAHMELGNPDHRRTVQAFWDSPRIAAAAGLKAVEMFEAIHAGSIKAVWIMGTNPVVSMPDADRVREALARCEMVVVSDCIAKTDTTACADVLLPAAAWGEKDGTVTNSERLISRQRSFLEPPGEARPDWWIVCEVARHMGFEQGFTYESVHEIFVEHARLSGVANEGTRAFDISGLAGLTGEAFEALEPVQWPMSGRPFADGRFMHPDGRARLIATPPRFPVHAVNGEFPFVLNTGRVRDQWHTMTRTGRSPRLAQNAPEPFVDIHPHDALLTAARGGELARVTTKWGSLVVRVRSSAEVARGTVFIPMHWNDRHASQARVGAAVNPIVDAVSGEPEFKHTPASVEPFPVEWYGFVLTRRDFESPLDLTWWTRIRGQHCTRYEIAGRQIPQEWSAWARHLLGAAVPNASAPDGPTPDGADTGEFIELQQPADGLYRAAYILGGRLQSCLYISDRAATTGREPLTHLFALDRLDSVQRSALLTGGAVVEDIGPIVCSCFGVGKETLRRVIREQGLSEARQVGSCLRAGTNCGSCLPEIQSLLVAAAQGDGADRAIVTEAGTRPNRIPVSTSSALPLLT